MSKESNFLKTATEAMELHEKIAYHYSRTLPRGIGYSPIRAMYPHREDSLVDFDAAEANAAEAEADEYEKLKSLARQGLRVFRNGKIVKAE